MVWCVTFLALACIATLVWSVVLVFFWSLSVHTDANGRVRFLAHVLNSEIALVLSICLPSPNICLNELVESKLSHAC